MASVSFQEEDDRRLMPPPDFLPRRKKRRKCPPPAAVESTKVDIEAKKALPTEPEPSFDDDEAFESFMKEIRGIDAGVSPTNHSAYSEEVSLPEEPSAKEGSSTASVNGKFATVEAAVPTVVADLESNEEDPFAIFMQEIESLETSATNVNLSEEPGVGLEEAETLSNAATPDDELSPSVDQATESTDETATEQPPELLDDDTLPPAWRALRDAQNHTYFWNIELNTVQWEHPVTGEAVPIEMPATQEATSPTASAMETGAEPTNADKETTKEDEGPSIPLTNLDLHLHMFDNVKAKKKTSSDGSIGRSRFSDKPRLLQKISDEKGVSARVLAKLCEVKAVRARMREPSSLTSGTVTEEGIAQLLEEVTQIEYAFDSLRSIGEKLYDEPREKADRRAYRQLQLKPEKDWLHELFATIEKVGLWRKYGTSYSGADDIPEEERKRLRLERVRQKLHKKKER